MNWREIRDPGSLEAWQEYYQGLPLAEKQKIRSEMMDELEQFWRGYMEMLQTDMFKRRQVDTNSLKRKRRRPRRA